MGSFVSKSSEETAATKSNEAAILRSGNDGAAIVRRSGRSSDLKGLSKLIMNDTDLDIYVRGLRKGFLFSALFLQCGALVCLAVSVQCSCEMLIPKLQEKIRDRKSKGVYDHDQDSAILSELETWEKERESAVAYMKKHKYIGKLCEMFHPKD